MEMEDEDEAPEQLYPDDFDDENDQEQSPRVLESKFENIKLWIENEKAENEE